MPAIGPAIRAVACIVLISLAACRPESGDGTGSRQAPRGIPGSPPSITGTVTAVGPGRALRVEERPEDLSGSAKAYVRLTDDAVILTRAGAATAFASIGTGARVSAWFIGPVAESYPVQATANVLVLETGNP